MNETLEPNAAPRVGVGALILHPPDHLGRVVKGEVRNCEPG